METVLIGEQTRFVIYGIQRTGTILLMGLLDSHPDILCTGELFQNKSDHVQHAIPRYRLYLKSSPARRMLDLVARKITVQRYLAAIYSSFDFGAIGFKLMLNQAKKYPQVLDYLIKNEFKVIHLIRENLLKTHISRLRARQTGIYTSEHPVQKTRVHISANSLVRDLASLAEENAALENSVSGLGLDYLTLSYERLASANQQSELQRVLSFLEVADMAELKPRTIKLTPDDLKQAVENYDEIARALRHTEYESCLHPGPTTS